MIPPAGSPARAAFYRWLFFAAGPLEQAITVKSQRWAVAADQENVVGFGNYDKTMATLRTALQSGPYICGEQFTAADVYIGSHIGFGLLFNTIETNPDFEAYVKRLYARPAFQRAEQINDEQFKSA